MDGSLIIKGIWTFLDSGIGFAVIWAAMTGFFMLLASRFNPIQEKWKKYEGSIITGIKLAEKQIPDDTPNAGLAKLDAALKFVLEAYAEDHNGKKPPSSLREQLKQGIQIKHQELARWGGLSKRKDAVA